MQGLEDNKRHQIHLLKKQEEDCSMLRGERRAIDGHCRDLSKRKESISAEIRVSESCSIYKEVMLTYTHTGIIFTGLIIILRLIGKMNHLC